MPHALVRQCGAVYPTLAAALTDGWPDAEWGWWVPPNGDLAAAHWGWIALGAEGPEPAEISQEAARLLLDACRNALSLRACVPDGEWTVTTGHVFGDLEHALAVAQGRAEPARKTY